MKKVITKEELRKKMTTAITLLCDTVKTTLGPKGSNTIIDHSAFSPFITNDGVTIARNICSDDEVINTILELAKESAINTDDIVGDGTTTTLVLLESIYLNGIKAIDNGLNPLILKEQLDTSLSQIISLIESQSRKPTKEELLNIAINSAGSSSIGKIIYQAFQKVHTKNAITLTTTDSNTTSISFQKGYIIDTLLAFQYLMPAKSTINNAKTLIINSYLTNLEDISSIINEIINTQTPLIIFAEDFDEYLTNQIITLNEQENTQIILLKLPGYGSNKLDILSDLSLITNADILSNPTNLSSNNIGFISQIIIDKELTTISFSSNTKIKEAIKKLKINLTTANQLEKSYIEHRLAMFTTGLVEINIGAPTQTEARELKMRYTDSLCAIATASGGIVPGSGLVLYAISEKLPDTLANQILGSALKSPLQEILFNAGLNQDNIIPNLIQNNFQELYNIKNDQYENIYTTPVIDPTQVVTKSLINATSIATMLLTTTNLIINEVPNNLNKTNEYNDL